MSELAVPVLPVALVTVASAILVSLVSAPTQVAVALVQTVLATTMQCRC